ncbi:MAG: hypothetical protein ACPG1A_08700 [Halioglobus sp.]
MKPKAAAAGNGCATLSPWDGFRERITLVICNVVVTLSPGVFVDG